MNKMNNPELEVVRFGAEDVIATSSFHMTMSNTPSGAVMTFTHINASGTAYEVATFGTNADDGFSVDEMYAYNSFVSGNRALQGPYDYVNNSYGTGGYANSFATNAALIHDVFGFNADKPMGDFTGANANASGDYHFVWNGTNWISSN